MTDRQRRTPFPGEQPAHPDDVRAVGYGPDDEPAVPERYAGLPVHREKSGRKDFWNANLRDPQPNSVYIVDNRYLFVTDAAGRVKHAQGWLGRLPSAQNAERRNLYAQRQAGKPDRERTDDGGHLFGTAFDGPGEDINMTAQPRKDNQMRKNSNNWRRMEDALLAKRVAGIQVHAKIEVRFPDATTPRPSARSIVVRHEGQASPRRIFRQTRQSPARET